jgi:hypothetical protein
MTITSFQFVKKISVPIERDKSFLFLSKLLQWSENYNF